MRIVTKDGQTVSAEEFSRRECGFHFEHATVNGAPRQDVVVPYNTIQELCTGYFELRPEELEGCEGAPA